MIIATVIQALIIYFQTDLRRINHALKVYGFAHAIAGLERLPELERQRVDLAAVLHDIGIKEAERKYQSSAGKYQELEGPPLAKTLMEQCGVDTTCGERVCFLIGNHHSYQKIDGVDFQILVEADFLVNIAEDQLEREAIVSIYDKYFKTASGKKLLGSMYLSRK